MVKRGQKIRKSTTARQRLALLLITVSFLALAFFIAPGYTSRGPRTAAQELEPRAYLPIIHGAKPAIIRITEIFRPDWLPKNGEYVKIENQGVSPQELTNWKLRNENQGQTYTFPTFMLQPGRWVKVYSRAGTNDSDELFWWHLDPWPIWGAGSVACIYEPDWTQVHCLTASR